MSYTSIEEFIRSIINNSTIVGSTKLDSTIKAIINYCNSINDFTSECIILYLNKLRVIYYLKRLKYYNYELFEETTSKSFS